MRFHYRWSWVFGLFFLCGCELTPEGKVFFGFLRQQGNNFFNWLGVDSAPSPSPSPSPSESAGVSGEQFTSAAARNAKVNSEILKEMFSVVFMREPKDRSEFGNWVDTLNQGASFEGVYNGFTHAVDYRKAEATHGGASAEALSIFSEELAYLEVELPTPTQFDFVSSTPLPAVQEPPQKKLDIEATASPQPSDISTPNPKVVLAFKEQYIKQFVGSSVFTLKRILGDEALKVMAGKSEYHEKLANWYAKWVVRLVERKVDFGIPLRNKADENFHYKWALDNNDDRIKWEILNRIHRLLNEYDKQKQ